MERTNPHHPEAFNSAFSPDDLAPPRSDAHPVAPVDTPAEHDVEAPADVDDYPWTDAATWYATDGLEASDLALTDEYFERALAAEVGSTDEMGWCGLLRRDGTPGGHILRETPYGRREVWEAASDDDLAERWEQLTRELNAYQLATGHAQARAQDREPLTPQIWVASLADYNAGHLHGNWMDATLDPDDLDDAIQFLLRNSHEPGAEEYAIFDYGGFGSELSRQFGEYPDLRTVARVAQGLTEHGPAFAAWAAYVGPADAEGLDRFDDHYQGEWASMEEYVEHYVEESEGQAYLDQVPEWLQPYVKIDIERLAQDMFIDMEVTYRPGGGVWVFQART